MMNFTAHHNVVLSLLRRHAEECGLSLYVSTHHIARETCIPEDVLFDGDSDDGILQELADYGLVNKQPTKSGACWCAEGCEACWPEVG